LGLHGGWPVERGAPASVVRGGLGNGGRGGRRRDGVGVEGRQVDRWRDQRVLDRPDEKADSGLDYVCYLGPQGLGGNVFVLAARRLAGRWAGCEVMTPAADEDEDTKTTGTMTSRTEVFFRISRSTRVGESGGSVGPESRLFGLGALPHFCSASYYY
jgi:hypothetical protein